MLACFLMKLGARLSSRADLRPLVAGLLLAALSLTAFVGASRELKAVSARSPKRLAEVIEGMPSGRGRCELKLPDAPIVWVRQDGTPAYVDPRGRRVGGKHD